MIFKLYEEESEMKPYAATTLAISLVLSASAFAQTVGVTVTNGDSQDLYVAVSDQNQSEQIVYNQRLNQGSSTAPLAVTADGNSKGSIVWRIGTTSTPPAYFCGSASGLADPAQITVSSWGARSCP